MNFDRAQADYDQAEPRHEDMTEDAIELIMSERAAQVKRWGNDYDDTHTQNDWVAFITSYAGRAVRKTSDPDDLFPTPDEFRDALIKVGALAVAGLEALARWHSYAGVSELDVIDECNRTR